MKSYTTHDIGKFEITSGKVIVSDPCYKRGTRGMGTLNVKKGKWKANVLQSDKGGWKNRVAALVAFHESVTDLSRSCYNWNWERQKFEVGVDSGQAGIFDNEQFHSEDDNYDNLNSWYRRCCDKTLGNVRAGIIEGGVVSSSGFGDGGYDCKTITKNGKIVAIMIDFGLIAEEEYESMNRY